MRLALGLGYWLVSFINQRRRNCSRYLWVPVKFWNRYPDPPWPVGISWSRATGAKPAGIFSGLPVPTRGWSALMVFPKLVSDVHLANRVQSYPWGSWYLVHLYPVTCNDCVPTWKPCTHDIVNLIDLHDCVLQWWDAWTQTSKWDGWGAEWVKFFIGEQQERCVHG